MKARDLFGVVIRSVGLCILIISLWYLVYGLAYLLNALQETGQQSEMGAYFLAGSPGVLAGFFLLRFARPIVRFCYPDNKEDSED
jgi:hypothetical protein